MKRKKLKSLRKVKQDTWKLMSKYIRLRDRNICFTCGQSGGEAGHLFHKDCLDYDKMNIHCQCSRCNKWLHGNVSVYMVRAIAKYSLKKINKLYLKSNQVKRFTRDELLKIQEELKKDIKKLDGDYSFMG